MKFKKFVIIEATTLTLAPDKGEFALVFKSGEGVKLYLPELDGNFEEAPEESVAAAVLTWVLVNPTVYLELVCRFSQTLGQTS